MSYRTLFVFHYGLLRLDENVSLKVPFHFALQIFEAGPSYQLESAFQFCSKCTRCPKNVTKFLTEITSEIFGLKNQFRLVRKAETCSCFAVQKYLEVN